MKTRDQNYEYHYQENQIGLHRNYIILACLWKAVVDADQKSDNLFT